MSSSIDKLLSLAPEDQEKLLVQAQAYLEMTDQQFFDKAKQLGFGDTFQVTTKTKTQPEQLIHLCDELTEQQPEYADVWRALKDVAAKPKCADLIPECLNALNAEPKENAAERLSELLGKRNPDHECGELYKALADAGFRSMQHKYDQWCILGLTPDRAAPWLQRSGDIFYDAGDYENAITSYRELLSLTQTSATSLKLATACNLSGRMEDAKTYYDEALVQIASEQQGLDLAQWSDHVQKTAIRDYQLSRPSSAAANFTLAMEIRRRVLGENSEHFIDSLFHLATTYMGMATAHVGRHQAKRAALLYDEALRVADVCTPFIKYKIIAYLIEAANACEEGLQIESAIEVNERLLELGRAVLLEQHVELTGLITKNGIVIDTLIRCGGLYARASRSSEALSCLEEARTMCRHQYNSIPPDAIAERFSELSSIYLQMHRFHEARSLLTESLRISRRECGTNYSYQYISCLSDLAGVYSEQLEYSKSVTIWNRVVDLARNYRGDDQESLANLLLSICVIFLSLRRLEEVLQILDVVDAFYSRMPIPTPTKLATALAIRGEAYTRLKDLEHAEPCLLSAISIFRAAGSEGYFHGNALTNLSFVYLDTDREEQARQLMTEATNVLVCDPSPMAVVQGLSLQVSEILLFGKNDEQSIPTLKKLALDLAAAEGRRSIRFGFVMYAIAELQVHHLNYRGALRAYRFAQRVFRQMPEDVPELEIFMKKNISVTHRLLNRIKRADRLLPQVVESFKNICGEDDPRLALIQSPTDFTAFPLALAI